MITTTLAILVQAESALRQVATQEGLSAKTKYHVAKLMRLVASETKHWVDERVTLFETLGVERAAQTPAEKQLGATVREILPSNAKDFADKMKDLGSVEVSIEWNPIKSTDLPNALASDLFDLGPLCELVEPDPAGVPPAPK